MSKLKNQTFSNFEAVIVNDGSTDKTELLVSSFINKNDLKWQLINQVNKGVGEARNTGLKNAKGEYVLLLDGDDYLSVNAIDKLYTSLIDNNADLSFSSYTNVSSSGRKRLNIHPNKIYNQYDLLKLFSHRLANIGIGNTLFKKDIVDKHKIKFENYATGEDNHFFRRLLLYIDKSVSIKDNLFFYVYNRHSVMNMKYSWDKLDSIYSVLDTIKEYKDKNIDKNIIDSLNIFLLSEIRGNAIKYIVSNKNMDDDVISTLNKKILYNMPNYVPIRLFFSFKRTIWLLKLLVFYKFPMGNLRLYKKIKGFKA